MSIFLSIYRERKTSFDPVSLLLGVDLSAGTGKKKLFWNLWDGRGSNSTTSEGMARIRGAARGLLRLSRPV